MEAMNTLTMRPLPDGKEFGSTRQRSQLGGRDVAHRVHGAVLAVGVDLEDPGRVVEVVEAGRAARAFVADRLAGLERGSALGERVAHRGAGHAITDLDDVRPIHARI